MLPTLTEDAWVDNPESIADFCLANFFASDYSQTQFYLGNVSSLAYLIQENNNNVIGTINAIETTLVSYLKRYLKNVAVQVSENSKSVQSGSSDVSLDLYVEFDDSNGNKMNLSMLLKFVNSKLDSVIKINNG